jgi:uncharacterized membrane protein YidH (DUF202 family)
MRNLTVLGVVLILLGSASLLFGHFSYSETKPILDAGPIHVSSQQEHYVSVPTIAGFVILLVGVGLVIGGRRLS